jgi:hypothetical protein
LQKSLSCKDIKKNGSLTNPVVEFSLMILKLQAWTLEVAFELFCAKSTKKISSLFSV